MQAHTTPPLTVAVLIPARNESARIGPLIDRLKRDNPGVVVVVSDCRSTDATAALAEQHGAVVARGELVTGRGSAITAGLARASELGIEPDVWWMLHADCEPAHDWHTSITGALQDKRVVGGAFTQRFGFEGVPWSARRLLRFVTFCDRTRYALTGVFYGDQGIFVRSDALRSIGGMPAMDLFEDVELCLRLRKLGRVVLLPQRMTTSPRRFLKNGVLRQLLHDTRLMLMYRLHGCRAWDAERYNREGTDDAGTAAGNGGRPSTLADAP